MSIILRIASTVPALLAASAWAAAARPPARLAPPTLEGPWVRPAEGEASQPVWGVKGGIRVGLWPTPGPRGLLRIYAPYLGHPPLRMINFIAVEPVVGRARGLSELEPSALDGVRGKAMWTGDTIEPDPRPRKPWQPARGRVGTRQGGQTLTWFVFVERFRNAARPTVQVTLHEHRPHEVEFRVFAAKGSAPMRACVLTATMGNYARLRHLWLKSEVVESTKLWPKPQLNRHGFTAHREWGLDRLYVSEGLAKVAATPDERSPADAAYAENVPPFWRYRGATAPQYWLAPAQKGLVVRVNGRTTYWASQAPIPGGIAYENFELVAPFADGQRFTFGVMAEPAEALGFDWGCRGNVTDGR